MNDYLIVYFAFVGQTLGGVEKKILQQFDTIFSLGRQIHLYLISSYQPTRQLEQEIKKRNHVHVLVNSEEALRNPFKRRNEKFSFALTALRGYPAESVICYFRYPNADHIFLRFLQKAEGYKIVTEHQEIENTFSRLKFNGNYLRNFSELVWGSAVRRRIDAFVGVTPEISDYEISVCGNYLKHAINIGNGITVNNFPLRVNDLQDPNVIKMLFIGSGYRSHGLFRLFRSIELYKKKEQNDYRVLLKIAGDSHEMAWNRRIVEKLKLSENIEFLGEVHNDELDSLFNWADIGVASLGLHRKGLKYGSTLKVREYLSRGLPFICAHIDGDLPDNFEYTHSLHPDDSTFDLEPLIEFVLRTRQDCNHPRKMRMLALEVLDWKYKMGKLLEFIDRIYQENK